jgi:transcriptional regulator with XRE-family HTH domain
MYIVKPYFCGQNGVSFKTHDINDSVIGRNLFMRVTRKSQSNFGQRLKNLRQARGFTQAELAKRIGCSQQIVEHYENRAKYPPIAMIPVIAKALRVSTDELLGVKPFKDEELAKNKKLMRRFCDVADLSLRAQRSVFHLINVLKDRQTSRTHSKNGTN